MYLLSCKVGGCVFAKACSSTININISVNDFRACDVFERYSVKSGLLGPHLPAELGHTSIRCSLVREEVCVVPAFFWKPLPCLHALLCIRQQLLVAVLCQAAP